jgi:hypothetical protein
VVDVANDGQVLVGFVSTHCIPNYEFRS